MNYFQCALCGDVHHRDEVVKLTFDETVCAELPDPSYVCLDCYHALTYDEIDELMEVA